MTVCLTCEGHGTFLTPAGTELPCPDCEAGMWNDSPVGFPDTWSELRWDMERGK